MKVEKKNNHKCFGIALTFAGFFALSTAAHSGELRPLPTAREDASGVLAWIADMREEKPLFSFRRVADVEELDERGKAKKKKRKVYKSVVIDGANFDSLISVDGKEPTGDQKKKNFKRMEEFREHQAERRKKKDPFFDEDLIERFIFHVQEAEYINGRKAFVVGFEPNPSTDLPRGDDKDVLASAVAGTLWIDAEDYAVARLEAHLIRPIRIGWGLLADFEKISATVSMQRTDEGDWFPKVANVYIWGKTLVFKPIRSAQVHRFVDVKRIR